MDITNRVIECSEIINNDPEYQTMDKQIIGIQRELHKVASNEVLELLKQLDFACAFQRVKAIELLIKYL